jgi:hypothetical protein
LNSKCRSRPCSSNWARPASASRGADALTDQDKAKLLDYLRRAHGDESKTKITLTRKQTSEIKATDSHGRARTVQVEVRKKRVLVKREAGEHAPEAVAELPRSSGRSAGNSSPSSRALVGAGRRDG